MQDEERYMTLNVKLEKRSSIQTSQIKFKGCSVMYWYKILLGISGAVNGILVLTFISLTLLVSQGVLLKCQKENDSNITHHDDIGNLEMNSDPRGNMSDKDMDHCASSVTDHGAHYSLFRLLYRKT
uniref:Killer cell lectin like receptor F1 n=1 Tax=Molossus molossus TaxID=27622 RepID=A0A7J8FZU6_MOLMO|nr:killer cell lectin like receptor F1 [Molossus molossus]